ncbi:hypothetical protein [Tunicatimonas pelagia]|uniref:hypothetical protein n=1 Tax=Tunicatimonas pelagia TaxID=931531 RepID=UPI0026667424|nr:hypothetical protein [Tunicatimonas pelagia]WKN45731.1 hypothetical protein P0M28_12260 [Tunicatimonas pelagia]
MKEEPDQKTEETKKNESQNNAYWLEQLGIPMGKKNFWNSDKFLSLLAFLISMGTFTTFAYQTYLIQKQQYASVLPYLMITPYSDGGGKYIKWRIGLANNGVGPAFINNVKIYYQDSIYEQSPSSFYFNSINHSDSADFAISNVDISPGYVLPAGKTIFLIGSSSEYSAAVINTLFVNSDERAIIEIEYSSIYDETWRIRSDDPIPKKIE